MDIGVGKSGIGIYRALMVMLSGLGHLFTHICAFPSCRSPRGVIIFLASACVLLGGFVNAPSAGTISEGKLGKQTLPKKIEPKQVSPYLPVYRVQLRVHLGNSGRAAQEFLPIFSEINHIWWSQAGICFEIHTVNHNTPLDDGLDMWFSPYIGGFNGYYDGEYIQMTDDPVLGWAPNPAKFSAARTASHELGHALDLPHRQDSDDNLLRSKTYGWQLNTKEIGIAREAAADMAMEDITLLNCGLPQIERVKQARKKQ